MSLVEGSISLALEDLYAFGKTKCEKIYLHPTDLRDLVVEMSESSLRVPGSLPTSGPIKIQIHSQFGSVDIERTKLPDFPEPKEMVLDTGDDIWLGGRIGKEVESESDWGLYRTFWADREVIIVTSIKLLVEKGSDDQLPFDDYRVWSHKVLKNLSEAARKVLVFHDTDLTYQVPSYNLDHLIKSLEIKNIDVQQYQGSNHGESVLTWKKRIMRLGGELYQASQPVAHPQSLAFSTSADHITFVDENGCDKYDIHRESKSKFLEMAKERERKANW